ncbi:helix-turn-helix transcriptional regulator [Sulfobacillus thermosulfidooxidans]|uniref:helix-turn-helix transcriptional regulator n=1 Tax=Sulfobacillus thermosulfidooxidans TaxID=28034 RepID=UPI000421ADE4|nr:helix-turn-helix transcriptional regulator [Sulfobacillus thermosulfidooxidans]
MANHVRKLRIDRGLTQEVLADRVGISRSTLSAIENGHIDPGVSIAIRLARALQTDVETIFPISVVKKGGKIMADRRAGKVPHVKTKDGGIAPRARRQDGAWRKKRSDAGKPRVIGKKGKSK